MAWLMFDTILQKNLDKFSLLNYFHCHIVLRMSHTYWEKNLVELHFLNSPLEMMKQIDSTATFWAIVLRTDVSFRVIHVMWCLSLDGIIWARLLLRFPEHFFIWRRASVLLEFNNLLYSDIYCVYTIHKNNNLEGAG